jgi:hypothetical protein
MQGLTTESKNRLIHFAGAHGNAICRLFNSLPDNQLKHWFKPMGSELNLMGRIFLIFLATR